MRFDYRKVRKAIVAALGAALFGLAELYGDHPWVQAAVAVATVLGVYQVPNAPVLPPTRVEQGNNAL